MQELFLFARFRHVATLQLPPRLLCGKRGKTSTQWLARHECAQSLKCVRGARMQETVLDDLAVIDQPLALKLQQLPAGALENDLRRGQIPICGIALHTGVVESAVRDHTPTIGYRGGGGEDGDRPP